MARKANKNKRFPFRPWEREYRKKISPAMRKRAAGIVQAMYDAGILDKFQQYLRAAYPGYAARSNEAHEQQNALFDTAADRAALDRLAAGLNAGTLGLDDVVEEMTGRLFGASSKLAFTKLGVPNRSWVIDSPAVRQAVDLRQNLIKGVDDTQFAAIKDLIRTTMYEQRSGITKHFTDQLKNLAEGASDYHAERIARTEVGAVQSQAAHTVYSANGVEQKEWQTAGDERVRDSHAEIDGEVVGMDEPFSNGLQYPGDPNGDPGEVINCRCSLAPVTSLTLDPDEVVDE